MSEDFFATSCEIARHFDGSHYRLTFTNEEGQSFPILLHQEALVQVAAALHSEIEGGKVVPIDSKSLRAGASFRFQGWNLQRRPDGAARLIVSLEMLDDGRVVQLPIDLKGEDVTSLVELLSKRNG